MALEGGGTHTNPHESQFIKEPKCTLDHGQHAHGLKILCKYQLCINWSYQYYLIILQTIWTIYKEASQADNIHAVAYTTFCNYWRTLMPQIVVGKPMSDLCWTCQQNSNIILKAVNKSAEEKSAVSLKPISSTCSFEYCTIL